MIALLNLTTRALTCSDDRTSSRRRDSYYSSVCFIFFAIFGSQPVAAARERDVIPLENLALGAEQDDDRFLRLENNFVVYPTYIYIYIQ